MGDEAAEMEASIAILGSLQGLVYHLILSEIALLDGLVDADDVLPNNTPGADVEMADFGIAHETVREADGKGGGLELGETGTTLGQLVHHRGVGGGNGVAILGGLFGRDTPAVNHDYKTGRASRSAILAPDIPKCNRQLGYSQDCGTYSSRPCDRVP